MSSKELISCVYKIYKHVINPMLEYQQINNIEKYCITNAQYLYDILTTNIVFYNLKNKVKLQAVFAISDDKEENLTRCVIHLVVMFDNIVLDPSYDVSSMPNVEYYDTIKKVSSHKFEKDYLTKFIQFIGYSKDMINGKGLINDKEYYHSQADYVESVGGGIGFRW